MTIARLRGSVGGYFAISDVGQSAGDGHMRVITQTNIFRGYMGGLSLDGPVTNNVPHKFKIWKDGTNANLQVDGAVTSVAHTGSLAANCNGVGLGAAGNVAAIPGDMSIAFYLLCSSKPTAAEQAALDAWALAYWGVP